MAQARMGIMANLDRHLDDGSGPPDRPSPETVELWLLPLALPPARLDRLAATLDAGEQRRLQALVHADTRQRFVAAHGGMRAVLGRRLGLPAAAVPLLALQDERPRLAGDALELSLAHAGSYALLGIAAGMRIGVDLEPVRELPDLDQLAPLVLAPCEQAALVRLPAACRSTAFLRSWTRKEAVLKAVGLGLAVDPAAVPTGFGRRVLHLSTLGSWHLRNLVPAAGHLAALATARPCRSVLRRQD